MLVPRKSASETALRSILALTERSDSASPASARRIAPLVGGIGPVDAIVVQAVSIVESYLDTCIADHLRRELPLRTPTALSMLEEIESSSSRTWESRRKALVTYLSIAIEQAPSYPKLDAAIQLRNCLVHGLGALTTQQRNKKGIVEIVAKVGVTIGTGRMISSGSTVRLACDAAAETIRWVDSHLP